VLRDIRSNRSGAIPRGMELLMNAGRYNRDVSTAASLNRELYSTAVITVAAQTCLFVQFILYARP